MNRRRAREIEHTRQDILEAAARAFARHGLQGATMRQIAQEAGYTAPALYTYFPSKQAIFDALVDHLLGQVLEVFEAPLPAGLTFAQKVELLLRRQLTLGDAQRDLFGILLAPQPAVLPAQADADGDPFGRYMAGLTDWMAEAAGEAGVGGRTPDELAWAYLGLEYAFLVRWVRGPGDRPLSEDVGRVLELFLRGVGA